MLAFPIRIENRSQEAIAAYIANEWHGGEWPSTDLFAAVRKSENKNAPLIGHQVYLAGEKRTYPELYTWKPGDMHEFSLHLNWPGTGSMPGRLLLSEREPGKYLIKVILIFRTPSDYGFEYAESPEMEVEVEAVQSEK
jgi:hypothetical protein